MMKDVLDIYIVALRTATKGVSRIGQHIKDEPCAKQRALLGIPSAVAQAFLEDTGSRITRSDQCFCN